MSLTARATFKQILAAVASQNVQFLEDTARIASSLSDSCPDHRDRLRDIELRALRQMFRVLLQQGRNNLTGSRPDRELAEATLATD